MIGRNLSHYEVLEELGRGGMGVVYKARDTRLNRLVALKILPPRLLGDGGRVELLRREAQASAQLNHPRIVTIYAVEEEADQLFLAMEFVDGQTLDRAIPRDGFDLDRFFKIAIPIADALSSAHDVGIVHRDLKPGNIILAKDDRPKILDFGVARLRPDQPPAAEDADLAAVDTRAATQLVTLEGKLAGTVPYMSPEQLSGGSVDHRTDIFSLGIVYYEMATGRHPYRSREGSIVTSILEDHPDSVTEVRNELPRQLGRIIGRCLEKDPAERIQSAKDLRNELGDLRRELATSPGTALPASASRGRKVAPAATLALLLTAAGGWLLYDRLGARSTLPTPYHLAFEETRIFPAERGANYLRRGILDSIRRRLTGLEHVYLLGEQGPSPDLTIQADARVAGDKVAVSFRLVAPPGEESLGDGVLEGSAQDLFGLSARAGRSIAAALGEQIGRQPGYRPGRPPTTDAVAFDLYLQAAAKEDPRGRALDIASTRDLLAQALRRDPEFGLAHLLAGQSYLEEHDTRPDPSLAATAEARCRTATENAPSLGAAYTCLGTALMLQDRTLEAVEALTRAIELDTSDLSPHLSLREAFFDLGLPESVEQIWLELIDRHPTFFAGYYSLGTYYQDAERYEDALAQYRRALELAPREPDVYSYLGTTYFYLGRYEEATVALQSSIEIRPTWDAYYNLGGIYFALRRFEAAVAAYQEAVRLAPTDYRSRGRLGWACYWAPDRRQEADEHLRLAIELADPGDPDALILSALFRAMLGEREESLEALDGALSLQPNDSHYYYLAGLAMNHLNETDSALEWLGRAVRGGWSTAEIRTTIDLENLHNDSRFQQLLREGDSRNP